ncbi:aldose epimerase family protein [Virgibacillus ainsalahensis]
MHINTTDILGKWKEYTLRNNHGMQVSILNYGGIITKIIAPDRHEHMENVVLGYKDYADYENNANYLGALIGRVAGRIQDAAFEMRGTTYPLESNDGKHHLHGGNNGFHQVIWDAETFQLEDKISLKLSHKSLDGEGGYPGNVDVSVTYTLNDENQLLLDYAASSDQTTPLTLTNHSYFNLSGDLKHTIHNHHVMINSEQFVGLDHELIPTGRLAHVAESPFDFRQGRMLRDGLNEQTEQNKVVGNGYDHYFIFNNKQACDVVVHEPESGRKLTIHTDQPGMVMYTSNNLDEGMELTNGLSKKHLGVCFETQSSPASLHHEGLPSVLLKPGENYRKQTVFSFGIEN